MTYRLEQHSDDSRYKIVEKDSELVVIKFDSYDKARMLCRSLNLGSGFNGYTPAFFTQEFKQKERPPT